MSTGHLTIPHIVDRLPELRDRILKARFRSAVVDELCRDYDTLSAALASKDRHCEDVEVESELKQLAKALEQEMLEWFSEHPDA